eukprot:13579220-Alexandrium_andersonii.AAC.1
MAQPPQEPPSSPPTKRAKDEDGTQKGSQEGWREYTPEEWAAWRAEQQERWGRMETSATDQRLFNKDLESRCNELRAEQT